MKKSSVLIAVGLAFAMVISSMPLDAEAMSIGKRFRGNSYSGTYEVTYDHCDPGNVGNVGYLIISQLKLKKRGKIKKGTKAYWDYYDSIGIKGKIVKNTKKKKKYRVRFNYPRKDGAFSGKIRGYITQKKIRGKYHHSYAGCEWGGKVRLKRQYN